MSLLAQLAARARPALSSPVRSAPLASSAGPWLVGGAVALAATALVNHALGRRAERRSPPVGRFVEVDGVRLHYTERGEGPPVLLLHGNGTMVEDWLISGLPAWLMQRHRVIVLDRPGFGHSERPRDRLWTPQAQAALVAGALRRIGVERPVVVGHSWGTMVALALAQEHPEAVSGLVLVSGYYVPTVRADVLLLSPPAIPLLGDVLRYTLSPLLARLMWPGMVRKLFAPAPVTQGFRDDFPREMALRPWQIRAAAEDTALMVPGAASLRRRYKEMRLPVAILAGDGDKVVEQKQARALHAALPDSTLEVVPGTGHMLHHLATGRVAEAVLRLAERVDTPRRLARAA